MPLTRTMRTDDGGGTAVRTGGGLAPSSPCSLGLCGAVESASGEGAFRAGAFARSAQPIDKANTAGDAQNRNAARVMV